MKKIISLFQRNYGTDHLVRNEIVPGAEWVIAGEGVATRKWDGTCCMVLNNVLYKRYDAKKGKPVPYGFIAAQDADAVTGHLPGWIEVGNGAEDKWHREAVGESWPKAGREDGTYELCGPKVQANRECFGFHVLIKHGENRFDDEPPRNFEGLKDWFSNHLKYEGIVWHHPDGRMVKIKARDFGFSRPSRVSGSSAPAPSSPLPAPTVP